MARDNTSMPDARSQARSGARPATRRSLVERLAGWSVRHRRLAVGGWFALVVVAVLAGVLVQGEEARTADPGESGRAQHELRSQDVEDGPARENVLVQSRADGGRLTDDPVARAAVEDLVAELRAQTGSVAEVRSPLDPDGDQLVSADGRAGLVTFEVTGPGDALEEHFDTATAAVDRTRDRHRQAQVLQAGDLSMTAAVDRVYDDDLRRSETLSLPLALVILLVVFGALVAASIPLLLSFTAVLATLGLLQAIGHVVPVNSTASSMVLLIGMAVGIDYSLFYLRRVREERAAGHDLDTALRATARTSGRAIAVSGIIVMCCLAGLFLTGMDVFNGVAIGTILVVGLAVIGSVTVLPATVAWLGRRVDRGRIPFLGRRQTVAGQSRAWSAVARAVVRRPLLLGGAAVLVLVALALPAAGLRLTDPAVTDSLPRSIPTVDAAARIAEAFPGGPSPAQVVVWGENATGPQVRAAVDRLHEQVAASDGALGEPISVATVGDDLVVRVPLAGSGTDETSTRALRVLREQALPATLGQVDGIDYAVTGRTAGPHDFATALSDRTPVVLLFVLALAFVLLLVTFRSLAVPCISIVLNLLSVGAAYGVVTWVFQDGHLESVFDFTSYGGVVSWLPLFMFVVLFGLSMDYHIFILSRIRERWADRTPAREAVVGGIGASAGVVSSAAVIMVAVFTIFVTLSAIEYKMLGVGMSVAVLVDATIVRGVLLPAMLSLLGDRAWWLPGARRRAPQVQVRPDRPVPGPAPAGPPVPAPPGAAPRGADSRLPKR